MISKERVRHTVHEYLDMRKLYDSGCRGMLTIDQKQQRIDNSELYLAIINCNKANFASIYYNRRNIYYNTPESKRYSAEWTGCDESTPKTQQSAGKIMASVFWDEHGIIFIDYLGNGQKINNDYYTVFIGAFES